MSDENTNEVCRQTNATTTTGKNPSCGLKWVSPHPHIKGGLIAHVCDGERGHKGAHTCRYCDAWIKDRKTPRRWRDPVKVRFDECAHTIEMTCSDISQRFNDDARRIRQEYHAPGLCPRCEASRAIDEEIAREGRNKELEQLHAQGREYERTGDIRAFSRGR